MLHAIAAFLAAPLNIEAIDEVCRHGHVMMALAMITIAAPFLGALNKRGPAMFFLTASALIIACAVPLVGTVITLTNGSALIVGALVAGATSHLGAKLNNQLDEGFDHIVPRPSFSKTH